MKRLNYFNCEQIYSYSMYSYTQKMRFILCIWICDVCAYMPENANHEVLTCGPQCYNCHKVEETRPKEYSRNVNFHGQLVFTDKLRHVEHRTMMITAPIVTMTAQAWYTQLKHLEDEQYYPSQSDTGTCECHRVRWDGLLPSTKRVAPGRANQSYSTVLRSALFLGAKIFQQALAQCKVIQGCVQWWCHTSISSSMIVSQEWTTDV